MSRARIRWVWTAALLCLAGSPLACRKDDPIKKRDPAVLDGMELTAARRVGLESAVDGMRHRDVERLKMLRVWVQSRAQVVLFQADDVKLLDLAIACLDGTLARSERADALTRIKSGQLLEPTRELCLRQAE